MYSSFLELVVVKMNLEGQHRSVWHHTPEGRCRSMQQEAEMRHRQWNQFGNAKFMSYCRFRPCPQLNHKGAGMAGVKPFYLQFKK